MTTSYTDADGVKHYGVKARVVAEQEGGAVDTDRDELAHQEHELRDAADQDQADDALAQERLEAADARRAEEWRAANLQDHRADPAEYLPAPSDDARRAALGMPLDDEPDHGYLVRVTPDQTWIYVQSYESARAALRAGWYVERITTTTPLGIGAVLSS